MEFSLHVTPLEKWRMKSAIDTQGISADYIYELIEKEIVVHHLHGAVLDYGAGAGNLTRRLLGMALFKEVVAVDLLPDRPEGIGVSKWLQQDLNEPLPGYDNFFDVVIASEIIEHLENPRLTARELFRLCRPGGYTIITTPNNECYRALLALAIRGHFVQFDKGWYPGHITALVRKDLIRILIEAGFEAIGFRFTDRGSIPGRPLRTWQEISFGSLRGLRFSDNLLVSARKPIH
jgi:2-polyprenyl-3-methyl-5-hydroxy-6-metoxy-1,4-benzoquinol methylase